MPYCEHLAIHFGTKSRRWYLVWAIPKGEGSYRFKHEVEGAVRSFKTQKAAKAAKSRYLSGDKTVFQGPTVWELISASADEDEDDELHSSC